MNFRSSLLSVASWSVSLLLRSGGVPLLPQSSAYVASLEEFRRHTDLHTQRVVRLGCALHAKYQSHFPDVTSENVVEYLALHDRTKLESDPHRLREIGYQHADLPLARLFEFYNRPHLSVKERSLLNQVVCDVNHSDLMVGRQFFLDRGWIPDLNIENLPAPAQQLLMIERIADAVDRGENLVAHEEFSRRLLPASHFLQEKTEQKFARFLERGYDQITQNLMYRIDERLNVFRQTRRYQVRFTL